jgi:hypothetical protein
MAYADVAPMLADEVLHGRVLACLIEQACLRDLETDRLASYVMIQPKESANQFMFNVCADQSLVAFYADAGQSNITDNAILSKVQADWGKVAAALGFR